MIQYNKNINLIEFVYKFVVLGFDSTHLSSNILVSLKVDLSTSSTSTKYTLQMISTFLGTYYLVFHINLDVLLSSIQVWIMQGVAGNIISNPPC